MPSESSNGASRRTRKPRGLNPLDSLLWDLGIKTNIQINLFTGAEDDEPKRKPPQRETSDEQAANLARVNERIGGLVVGFTRNCMKLGKRRFHVEELLRYVGQHVADAIAPDSPGRILRLLRQEKRVEYTIVSRSESLYEIVSVDGKFFPRKKNAPLPGQKFLFEEGEVK